MKNKFLVGLIVGAAVSVAGYYMNVRPPEISRVAPGMRKPLNASCLITTSFRGRNYYGTGILLKSRYILTASHVVDVDGDNRFTPKERDVRVHFYGDSQETYNARVVYNNSKEDFAILQPEIPEDIIGMAVSLENSKVGTPVYTIGATNGFPLRISSGHVAEPHGDRHRTSCYISTGNSGGGLFEKNKVVGIINTVDIKPMHGHMNLLVPTNDGFVWTQGRIHINSEVNGVSGYVPIELIREELEYKQIGHLLDELEEVSFFDRPENFLAFGVLKALTQIALILCCTYAFRRQLFR